jgi:hypothetical protein
VSSESNFWLTLLRVLVNSVRFSICLGHFVGLIFNSELSSISKVNIESRCRCQSGKVSKEVDSILSESETTSWCGHEVRWYEWLR